MARLPFLACVLALVPALSAAQERTTPLGDLRSSSPIVVAGTVTAEFGNKLILADRTGQVLVDAGPAWFRRYSFHVGETLTVVGRMDGDEFEALEIRRADGSTAKIRPHLGPPPWARGRSPTPD